MVDLVRRTATATSGGEVSSSGLAGKTNGAAIAAGYVGERLSGTFLSPSVTNNTQVNMMSLTLTAGVWVVHGKAQVGTAGSTQTRFECSIGTTSATLSAKSLAQDNSSGIVGDRNVTPGSIYINTTGTTVYLVVRSLHTGTDPVPTSGYNELYAIRVG